MTAPRLPEAPRATDWFLPLRAAPSARTHLYALPHAGGGPTAFTGCADLLDPDVAMWGLNLPGRQARFSEPPCTALEPLLDTLTAEVGRHDPWVLFGYCSGALLAFLVARHLRRAGRPMPSRLVVASYAAPDRAEPPAELHTLPAETFWTEILSYGGVSDTVAAQPDFRDIFEPALRADYELLSGYRYHDEPAMDLPVTVLVGDRDAVLRPSDVDGWSRHTTGPFVIRTVPGGHWLIDENPRSFAAVLGDVSR